LFFIEIKALMQIGDGGGGIVLFQVDPGVKKINFPFVLIKNTVIIEELQHFVVEAHLEQFLYFVNEI